MDTTPRDLARDAKTASLKLRVLPSRKRSEVLVKIADAVESQQEQILAKNAVDVENAAGSIADALMKRLQLKEGKLSSAVAGIRQIAQSDEPIGRPLSKTQIMKGLTLEKVTVPIGVLLIIFEVSHIRGITALAIRSGNGLLLKGGKEATESNIFLHQLICNVLNTVVPEVGSGLVGLVQKREDIADLLKLDDVIDLVIPRGSNQLVSYIQQNTKIAVLGHADGICHLYIDEDADFEMACRICLDAKTDYPAACNAVETILLHSSFMKSADCDKLCDILQSNGVQVYKGRSPRLAAVHLSSATSLRHEYSSLEVTMEVVENLEEAIEHINTYGSGHTDSIITQNPAHAESFLKRIDSACVLHNASTRWSDGYRFGLGAEVGISTSRIHARGPVGVEGLMTTKFVLSGNGHVVNGDAAKQEYTFKDLSPSGCDFQTKGLFLAAGFLAAMTVCCAAQYFQKSFSR